MPKELDYKAMWQRLQNMMTSLAERQVRQIDPIIVSDYMHFIYISQTRKDDPDA